MQENSRQEVVPENNRIPLMEPYERYAASDGIISTEIMTVPEQLEFVADVSAGAVDCNFTRLKESLSAMAKDYTTQVYTGEKALQEMKKDRAELARLQKQVNDKKIEVKKRYMIPLEAFEKGVKELLECIEQPRVLLDKRIKKVESELREIRKKDIEEYYWMVAETTGFILDEFSNSFLKKIWNEKWLNADATKKTWKMAIDNAVEKYMSGVLMLTGMNEPDFLNEALVRYQQSLEVVDGVNYINEKRKERERIEKAKMEAAERARAEAEARHKDELEKARAEMESRAQAEIKRARAERNRYINTVPINDYRQTVPPVPQQTVYNPVNARQQTVRMYVLEKDAGRAGQLLAANGIWYEMEGRGQTGAVS